MVTADSKLEGELEIADFIDKINLEKRNAMVVLSRELESALSMHKKCHEMLQA